MAVKHGKDGVLKVGSDAVGSLTSVTLNEKAATASKAAMTDTWDSHLVGLLSGTGKATAWLNPSDTAQQALTIGASVTISAYFQGTTTGLKYETYTATVTGITFSGDMSAPSKREFDFEVNGAVTESTA